VFVNTDADTINLLADFCGLDRVQLSGDETFDYCNYIKKPIIKAVHISSKWTEEKLISHLEEGRRVLGTKELTYLLDTYEEQKYGGTGKTFSWDVAKKVANEFPIIIAGGLGPDNVGWVIADVKPWGVDVSSGVETNGVKDIDKIKAFVRAVRSIE
jgi:phosphoribosylanthranilate isomerase